MSETTFIYALTCPDTGEVRYIGKANNPQLRLKSHLSRDDNKRTKRSYKSNWIKSLIEVGKYPSMIILEEITLSDWKESEKRWIAYYRLNGANLTNITDGGQGGFTRKGLSFPQVPTMKRFELRISDELDNWLSSQAISSHRSKNQQIQHILERAMKDTDVPRYRLGVAQLCANGTHLFINDSPLMSDFCNCGMFMFGEVR